MESEIYGAFPNSMETEVPQAELLAADVVGVPLVVVNGHYGAIIKQDRSAPMLCFHSFLDLIIGFLVFSQFGDNFRWMQPVSSNHHLQSPL